MQLLCRWKSLRLSLRWHAFYPDGAQSACRSYINIALLFLFFFKFPAAFPQWRLQTSSAQVSPCLVCTLCFIHCVSLAHHLHVSVQCVGRHATAVAKKKKKSNTSFDFLRLWQAFIKMSIDRKTDKRCCYLLSINILRDSPQAQHFSCSPVKAKETTH